MPVPITGQGILLQVKSLVLGEFCYNNFWYISQTPFSGWDLEEFLAAWYSDVGLAWKALLADSATLYQATAYLRGEGTSGEFAFTIFNEEGDITGQALPPAYTMNIALVPDNTDLQPPGLEPEFRRGRVAISGVAEAVMNQTGVDPTYAAAVQGFADSMLAIPAGFYNLESHLFMYRPPDTTKNGAEGRVFVDSAKFSRWGTQNTRKV